MSESLLLLRAKNLRKNMTEAEKKCWFFLRSRRFNHWKFRRQVIIVGYIVDFVCLSKHLIIEIDGSQHSNNLAYDQERTYCLQQEGYRVIRFWNNDVLKNTSLVLEAIYHELIRN